MNDTIVSIMTHATAIGVGCFAGAWGANFVIARQNKLVERIIKGSLNSPLSRDIRLGRIRRIADDGEGMIKLDHPADTENFEVGDYIRAMCGKHDRFAIAKVVMRDRTRAMIAVSTMHHPRDKKLDLRPDTPYDWQPGDVLMPFDPIV